MPTTVPNPVPSTKKSLAPFAVSLVTLVIGAVAGYGWAMRSPSGAPAALSPAELRTCNEEATKALTEAGIIEPEPEQRAITGTITSVSGNTVKMAVGSLARNPLAEATPAERMVTVTPETKLTLRVMRDEEEYFNELQAYQTKIFAASEGDIDSTADIGPGPLAYTEKTITLADLKEGVTVTVSAEMDILRAKEFTATELAVIQQAERAPSADEGANNNLPPDAPVLPPTDI